MDDFSFFVFFRFFYLVFPYPLFPCELQEDLWPVRAPEVLGLPLHLNRFFLRSPAGAQEGVFSYPPALASTLKRDPFLVRPPPHILGCL